MCKIQQGTLERIETNRKNRSAEIERAREEARHSQPLLYAVKPIYIVDAYIIKAIRRHIATHTPPLIPHMQQVYGPASLRAFTLAKMDAWQNALFLLPFCCNVCIYIHLPRSLCLSLENGTRESHTSHTPHTLTLARERDRRYMPHAPNGGEEKYIHTHTYRVERLIRAIYRSNASDLDQINIRMPLNV